MQPIHNIEGGTHLSGFRTALTRVINNYARQNDMLKEKDLSLTGDDVREGLTAVASVKVRSPDLKGKQKRNFPTARWMESFSELSEKNEISF